MTRYVLPNLKTTLQCRKNFATMVHLLNGILEVNVLTDKKSQSCGAIYGSTENLKETRKNMSVDSQIQLCLRNYNYHRL